MNSSESSVRSKAEREKADVAPAPILDDLRPIAGAVRIESESRFTFAGKLVDLSAPGRSAVPPLQPHPNPLVENLLPLIYQHCYCRRFRGVLEEPAEAGAEDDNLATDLSAANSGTERTDRGWQLEVSLSSGSVVARKGTVTRTFFPGEFVVPGLRGQPAMAGAPLTAAMARESWSAQPGFYLVYGDAMADDQDDRVLVRFYWNVDRDRAPSLLRGLTSALNGFEVPFRLKCPSHRGGYFRCDTMVLYLSRRHARIGFERIAPLAGAMSDGLRDDTPLFTLRLARGLAFAEDPGNHESFGTNRARLFAEGLWKGHVEGAGSDEARLSVVAGHFAANGVDLSMPWRCRPDRFDYGFAPMDKVAAAAV
jgi:hypothetical protein